ncbi:hypothetical protein HDV05_003623 [Chytridiales sp. JEL 0842]|nr:hypothetical protein HDV05_003623 [Chytridiales sp. JEL 0842]
MSNRSILRLQKELYDIQKSPDHQIKVACDENNIKHMHALLCGPAETPYWRGEAGEEWSSAHGVFSILVSIQSLLHDHPYHNEPGHENEKDKTKHENYNQKIMHETLRISICNRLEEIFEYQDEQRQLEESTNTAEENTEEDGSEAQKGFRRRFCTCQERSPFEDFVKRCFLWYYDIYMDIVEKEIAKGIKDGQAFVINRFEGSGNQMQGTFNYTSIKERLQNIYKLINKETETWAEDSKSWISEDLTIVTTLRSQYQQITSSGELADLMSIDLEQGNPFIWNVCIFGPQGTHYESGMFQARIVFHKSFPESYPRVKFEVDVFHPKVTVGGVPHYNVQRVESVKEHLKAIYALFTAEPECTPATFVNPEAAKLYFGSKEDKKNYARKVRRCAQRSVE